MATTKLTQLFRAPDALASADTTNNEGFPAFSLPLPERCLRVLTTGVFENTFYAKAQTLAEEALDVFRQMAGEDAELFARMIVYARNEGLLRTVPIAALVVLSTAHVDLFQQAFPLVIRTPNDLRDFVTLVHTGSVRAGMGRSVKRAVNDWLSGLSEYHAIKYGSGGNAFALRDVLRLTRPKPVAGTRSEILFQYLVKGYTEEMRAMASERIPQVAAFETLKATEDAAEQRQLVEEGRLPYEVVVGAVKPDRALWERLMRQMPQFALLRHLNALAKAGVFEDAESVRYVCERLTNADAVQKSKILPFRWYTAHGTLTPVVPRAISEAVEVALELSLANMPRLAGRVCISPDISGSMAGLASDRGKTRFVDIAAIFAAACLRQSSEALVLPFNHEVQNCRVSGRDTLMTTARTLAGMLGGGTAVGAPARWLRDRGERIDTFIGITDNEDWCYGWDGQDLAQFRSPPPQRGTEFGFLNLWRDYRRTVHREAQAFLVTVSPHQTVISPPHEPGVHYVFGWSDAVLPFIQSVCEGYGNQMDEVRKVAIHGPTTENHVLEDGLGDAL